jgi:hypothetical protein
LEQITILRRFSDIEWLHYELLKNNPGCRIPDLPEKNVKFNSAFINENDLNLRKKGIQDYLNYIANHKYLSSNHFYEEFISQDFKRNATAKTISNLITGVSGLKTSVLGLFGKNNTIRKGSDSIEGNKALEKERDYLIKLYYAIADKDTGLHKNIVKNKFT